MNDQQHFQKRVFDAVSRLNRGRDDEYRRKPFVNTSGQCAVCFFTAIFHTDDLLPIAEALADEGLEITSHTVYPVSGVRMSVFVWVRGIGAEVR